MKNIFKNLVVISILFTNNALFSNNLKQISDQKISNVNDLFIQTLIQKFKLCIPINQQVKLVGTPVIGIAAEQGISVSLSADGNTLAVGGINDNTNKGATWIFIRSGIKWTQQAKLVGNNAVGPATQGVSVSLSADGNTLAVGGFGDNNNQGATWIFTRSGTKWTQQAKLVGNNAVGNASQGGSVSLSADGNILAVGGNTDNNSKGATWIFTRAGTKWTQQTKLIGTQAVGRAEQGDSVSLSADGNTLAVGGPNDNNTTNGKGATWIFTRSGTKWTQQTKLVGTQAIGDAQQGNSVFLSADGNTLAVGGFGDNNFKGATWIFTRSGTNWIQQSKLVGTQAIGAAQQGFSVSLSADGNILAVGGNIDNNNKGATWIFTRSGTKWIQQSKLVGTQAIGAAQQGHSVSLSADGKTLAVGGTGDNNAIGATWIFT